jgi:hypothetical protein
MVLDRALQGMTVMRATQNLLVVLALAAPAAAQADEIGDQLNQARHYYEDGDITAAIDELKFVLQALRGRIGQELLATFLAPPEGWTAETGDDSAGAIPLVAAGTMLSRTYRSPDGASSIEAQLMSGGGFLQGLAGMMMNPAMLAAQPNAKRVRVGRENGVVTYDSAQRSAQLILDLSGKATVMLEGKGVASGDSLEDLAQRWDLKKVGELLGG